MKRQTSVLMALVMMFAMNCVLSAAPRTTRIKPVKSATAFKGRQTPRFKAPAIVIPPVDLAGGDNLKKAQASIARAIADVENEVKDQNRIIKGYKTRVTAAQKNISKYVGLKRTYTAQRDSIQAEINVLEGISNPSAAIQACIAELKEDLAAANKQLANVNKTIKEYEMRVKFYNEVGAQAKKNLTRLNTALAHIKKGKTSLGLVKLSKPKATMTKPMRFK
jgi:DNA repair exonuclease SbcCD ATPase subunit